MNDTPAEVLGRYKHYKGNEYEVIGVGIHTETEEKMVIYRGLYEPYQIWVRPFDMFFEKVLIDGTEVPRFSRIES